MGKKKKHCNSFKTQSSQSAQTAQSSQSSQSPQLPQSSQLPQSLKAESRDKAFWRSLKDYNALDTSHRAEGLKELGMFVTDDEVLWILTKSHFVIPGITRLECRNCGECCRYAKKIATFTYERCALAWLLRYTPTDMLP